MIDPPGLHWRPDGTPYSPRYDDLYHAAGAGVAEARHVVLDGLALPASFAAGDHFVLGETGFGTGLNVLVAWQAWRDRPDPTRGHLSILSLDAHPLSRAQMAAAADRRPEIGELAARLAAAWPDPAPGWHRIVLDRDVTLTLMVGEAAEVLAAAEARVDGWVLDGFSPAKNPDMWSEAVFRHVARLSAPGAALATFTAAGSVRRGLAAAGFEVAKAPGFGSKRDMTRARLRGTWRPHDRPRAATVIGAGLAGAGVAHALSRHGVRATVLEAGPAPGSGGSGAPVMAVMPRPTAAPSIVGDLSAHAARLAAHAYGTLPDGCWRATGALWLSTTDAIADRQRRASAATPLADGRLRMLDRAAAADRVGAPVASGGLWLADAGAIDPAAVLAAWLSEAEVRPRAAGRVDPAVPTVIAAGLASAALCPDVPLTLRPRAGAWSRIAGVGPPDAVVVGDGQTVPGGDGALWVGAGFHAWPADAAPPDPAIDAAANLAKLARLCPGHPPATVVGGWAGVRATTPDHLPLVGRVEASRWLATGYGARGATWAPLMAEVIAADLLDLPRPLPHRLLAALDPWRQARRNNDLKM